MKAEIARLKREEPELSAQERFKKAASTYERQAPARKKQKRLTAAADDEQGGDGWQDYIPSQVKQMAKQHAKRYAGNVPDEMFGQGHGMYHD